MNTPLEALKKLNSLLTGRMRVSFLTAFLGGLLIHLPAMLMDAPNHDGLASVYFDQNMITSGRWFLSVACGLSSYFTLPWLIGLLGMLFLGLTALVVVELLDIQDTCLQVIVCGLLVSFPAIASTFAYVFTLDGYMLALLLAVLSVYVTNRWSKGFLPGAVLLGCSLGIYQAYLPVAAFLCLYMLMLKAMDKPALKEWLRTALRYVSMGALGAAFYLVMLKLLLLLQGKSLAAYQGINSGLGQAGEAQGVGALDKLANMYVDFLRFSLNGGGLFHNKLSLLLAGLLAAAGLAALVLMVIKGKWYKKPAAYIMGAAFMVLLPVVCNLILWISPEVNYHLLMRYHWVLLLVALISLVDRCKRPVLLWMATLAGAGLVMFYAVTDQIGYANLSKKYEKTYSYCVRLLDRIEQTPGYYPGIPIAMIGVVSQDQYPLTDVTGEATAGKIGLDGDYLIYTGANYESFMKHYLGATLNILPPEAMAESYYASFYVEMESFPGPDSIRIVDGIMYIKTENMDKNLLQ